MPPKNKKKEAVQKTGLRIIIIKIRHWILRYFRAIFNAAKNRVGHANNAALIDMTYILIDKMVWFRFRPQIYAELKIKRT